MKIPFVDLKAQYLSIKTEIDTAIFNVINETAFIGGKYVQDFEQAFAEKYGIKHCISVANGTDSLYIIMKMLNIGNGDEVITVANSWISTSETISQTGAKPIFIDIDKDSYTIDVTLIESKINEKTKAIIPVHLYGQACDMDELLILAERYKIPIIEDCAQSHFSEYKNRKVGTFGIAGSFSFYPGKNLGAYGDAGCIITNNSELAEKCKMYARHGALKKHNHLIEGINSRLDGIQASILLAKLPYIQEWTKKRINNAKLYYEYLKTNNDIVLPSIKENTKHSFHLFVIRTDKRNELSKYLNENGIETAVHYPVALVNMPAYAYLGIQLSDYPNSMEYQHKILSLPMYPELTEEQIFYISEKINFFFKSI
jgi:dTDP-4-amino-4,6-dideoxygalactose transaminase